MAALVGLCLILLSGCRPGGSLPAPGSEAYREAVASFYGGLAAMQVGEDTRAEARLRWLTDNVPGEPASFANLGLLILRRNAPDLAAPWLEEARSLAPDDASIQLLSGRLEEARDRPEAALAYFRRAVALDSTDVEALYALAQASYDPESASTYDAYRLLLRRILTLEPTNLPVTLDLIDVLIRLEEWTRVAGTLDALAGHSDTWPEAARAQFQAVRDALPEEEPQRLQTELGFLRNTLLRHLPYREDLRRVQPPLELVSDPITRFLRLSPPIPVPAAPDDSLFFEPQTLSAAGSTHMLAYAVSFTGEGPPSLVTVGTDSVRIDDSLSDGSGTTMVLPFPSPPEASRPSLHALAPLDYDYDFRLDLALADAGGFRLFGRDSTVGFRDRTGGLGLPASITEASYAGVWAADLDLEGDLDLVLGPTTGPTVVLRNNGDGTFTDVPWFDMVPAARDFAWGDFDGDGDPDGALIGSDGGLVFLSNERSARFSAVRPSTAASGVAALAVADTDRDALLELLLFDTTGAVVRYDPRTQTLRSDDPLIRWPGLPPFDPGEAVLHTFDSDNNGAVDLMVSMRHVTRMALGTREATYLPLDAAPEVLVTAAGEVSGDGRLDLVGVTAEGDGALLVNRGSKPYQWVEVRPRAAQAVGDQRINSFGIGGEIEVRAGTLFQKQPIRSPIVHFGLGEYVLSEVIRIVWPNGDVQAEFDVVTGQAALARQRLKGSCPWVFTYDGSGMTFITDFIWRSPLGLRINAQETAGIMTTEDWIRIDGERLVARDGLYDVRITAELWETHFFDHVSLLAVDRPEDTEVFVDERFAFPPPAPALHATAPLRPVARVTTDTGEDVTEQVAALDEAYLDFFERGRYQGVTREHFIEIDLGPGVPDEGPVFLVGSGWVRPTDSSINVALGQGSHPAPRGLRLETPDGAGGWRVVHENMGFPSGKTKTVLLDLEHAFLPGTPRRVRLSTNLEIYWDRLAWTVALPQTQLQVQRLNPTTAELRYRGYSEVHVADASSPELPDYEELAGTYPVWRDLEGYYTRFGDVGPLLEQIDDRYVIMNAGDELALSFPALAPPPEGYRRDFVLIGDGWVKDGDYNTTFSRTVLPLPAHDMPAYDRPPTRLEDDPVYRRHPGDWRTYHTRYVTPDRFHHALRIE